MPRTSAPSASVPGAIDRRLSRPSVLVGIGSLRCVSGWPTRATVLVDSVGVTSSPVPGAITARSGPARPGQAGLGQCRGQPVAGGDGVHRQQVVGRRERRGDADLGHRGPAGRPRRELPGRGQPGTRHRDPAQRELRAVLRRVAQCVLVAEPGSGFRGRVGGMRQPGGERLVAGQAAPPRPGVWCGLPRSGEPAEGGGPMPLPEPERGKRLAAFGGERRDTVAVARVADGRDRRVHVVERQRGGGQARRRPQQPEVGEEAVALQWERAGAAAVAAWKVEHRAAVVAAHPPGQAAVALAKQRVDDARSNDSFGMSRFGIRGPAAPALPTVTTAPPRSASSPRTWPRTRRLPRRSRPCRSR